MQFVLLAGIWAAAFFLLISVHELGHYLAGWLGGIPRSEMRIRLLTFPQHVALNEGDRWLAPFNLESYVAVMQRHLRTTPRLYQYTAGGMLFETAVTVAVVLSLLALDRPKFAFVLAFMSLWLWLVFVFLMDVPMAIRRGHPWGDLSGMWWLARWPTVLLAMAMIGIRMAMVWATSD